MVGALPRPPATLLGVTHLQLFNGAGDAPSLPACSYGVYPGPIGRRLPIRHASASDTAAGRPETLSGARAPALAPFPHARATIPVEQVPGTPRQTIGTGLRPSPPKKGWGHCRLRTSGAKLPTHPPTRLPSVYPLNLSI